MLEKGLLDEKINEWLQVGEWINEFKEFWKDPLIYTISLLPTFNHMGNITTVKGIR